MTLDELLDYCRWQTDDTTDMTKVTTAFAVIELLGIEMRAEFVDFAVGEGLVVFPEGEYAMACFQPMDARRIAIALLRAADAADAETDMKETP